MVISTHEVQCTCHKVVSRNYVFTDVTFVLSCTTHIAIDEDHLVVHLMTRGTVMVHGVHSGEHISCKVYYRIFSAMCISPYSVKEMYSIATVSNDIVSYIYIL